MMVLLQTVVIEDSGFNEIWAGIFTLVGALVGAGAAVLSTWISNRHQRNLERDSELRRWRLQQFAPTLEEANTAYNKFQEWDDALSIVMVGDSSERLKEFLDQILLEATSFRHMGQMVAVGKGRRDDIEDALALYLDAYGECFEDLYEACVQNVTAFLLGLPGTSLLPSEAHHTRLFDSIVILNHALERYAFGVGKPSSREAKLIQELNEKSGKRRLEYLSREAKTPPAG